LCNSCASLAGLVLYFIACFTLLVIAPLQSSIAENRVQTVGRVHVICRSRRLFCTPKTTYTCWTGNSLAGRKKRSSLRSVFSITFWTWESGRRGLAVHSTRRRVTLVAEPAAAAATLTRCPWPSLMLWLPVPSYRIQQLGSTSPVST